MSLPEGVRDLEIRSLGQKGERTLPEAYELLKAAWPHAQSREAALHLAFLAWYLSCEPPWLTGLDESRVPESDRQRSFQDAHEYLRVDQAQDPELLYVFGLMATLFPYVLGDESTWKSRGEAYLAKHRVVAPRGADPNIFLDRGAFGAYFHHHATRYPIR